MTTSTWALGEIPTAALPLLLPLLFVGFAAFSFALDFLLLCHAVANGVKVAILTILVQHDGFRRRRLLVDAHLGLLDFPGFFGTSVEGSIVRSIMSLGRMRIAAGIWFEGVVFTPATADRIGEEQPAKKVGSGSIIRGDICALPTPTPFGTP
jgi:hypothetical protein